MQKLIFLLFFYYGAVWADPMLDSMLDPVASIDPFPGFDQVIETTDYATFGSCGKAIVQIQRARPGTSFLNSAPYIEIRLSPSKMLVLPERHHYYEKLICINTQAGYRLLLQGFGERGKTFDIIDAATLKYLSPRKKACNSKCASKILGNKIPQDIESGEFDRPDYDKAAHMFPAVR